MSDVYLFPSAPEPKDVLLRPIPPIILKIAGVTKDASGNPLSGCIVWLFITDAREFKNETISNENGEYFFAVDDDVTEHFIRAYRDGVLNIFGTTDRDLRGGLTASDVYLFPSAPEPKDILLKPIPPVPSEFNTPFRIRYIKMFVLVMRNKEVVHYATPYTPFRVQRPIQPQIME